MNKHNSASLFIIFIDTTLIIGAFSAAYFVREKLPLTFLQPVDFYTPLLVAGLVLFLISALYFRLYSGKESFLSLSYFVSFIKALSFWLVSLAAFGFFVKTDYSRALVILFFSLSVVLLYAVRVFSAALSRRKGGADEFRIMSKAAQEAKNNAWGSSLAPKQDAYVGIKRAMDVMGASIGLAILTPLFPFVVLAIRSGSEGPAIIKQNRIGLNGRRFKMYKFRTMYADADLYERAPREERDSRITRIGAFLRKTSIDELPQLWNVLRGEMSLVGPRPEMPFIVERYAYWERLRLNVKPGITGVWQIYGRKDLPLEENIEYDIFYVLHRSFFLDIALMLKTGAHLILPKGAY